jgi:trans-2,3-dihydro-3-hydroxyanthranilate isomerase
VTPASQGSFGYRLADVFAERPYEGNGVAVFLDPPRLSADDLLRVTTEVRQFESAYLWATDDPTAFETRIFVVDRELGFAGHPVLGAAAVLHERFGDGGERSWSLQLGDRGVPVRSRSDGRGGFDVVMDHGRPQFGPVVAPAYGERVARALSLSPEDLHGDLPMQWVSTGLRYLIVPVRSSALPRARIAVDDLGDLLAEAGALLAYVLDPDRREGRNWVNDGTVEDIATGSASGPAAAYLIRHGRAASGEEIRIAQGRFLDRPSIMRLEASGTREDLTGVSLTGHVCLTGSGTLDRPPGM